MNNTKPGRLRVGIISAGKVGTVLGAALRAAGHTIIAAYTASEANRDRLDAILPGVPVRDPDEIAREADAVLLAVPDAELEGLVEGLATLGAWRPGQLVVHTAGRFGMGVLDAAARAGAIPLAIHPAMSFTGTSLDLARLEGAPMAVTGPALYLPIGQALAAEMGGEPVIIEEEDRPLYHAALVHASTHLAEVAAQASAMLGAAGIENPQVFVGPVGEAALEAAARGGPAGIGGSGASGDAAAVTEHVRALEELSGREGALAPYPAEDVLEAYTALELGAVDRAEVRRAVRSEDAEAVRRALRSESGRRCGSSGNTATGGAASSDGTASAGSGGTDPAQSGGANAAESENTEGSGGISAPTDIHGTGE